MTTPPAGQPPPEQEQEYPGRTAEMDPAPRDEMRDYEGRGLLTGTRALITGGDSGIGRAVAAVSTVHVSAHRLSGYARRTAGPDTLIAVCANVHRS